MATTDAGTIVTVTWMDGKVSAFTGIARVCHTSERLILVEHDGPATQPPRTVIDLFDVAYWHEQPLTVRIPVEGEEPEPRPE